MNLPREIQVFLRSRKHNVLGKQKRTKNSQASKQRCVHAHIECMHTHEHMRAPRKQHKSCSWKTQKESSKEGTCSIIECFWKT